MLKSMTGYGRVKVENDLREITVELRSVNHRYLDLNIKVPRIYGYLEDVVSKQAQASIARGKVDIFVSVRAKEGADIKVTPNMAVIQGYVDALKKVSETYDINECWDGRYEGKKCQSGVYMYTCDIVCEDNQAGTFKGDVTIIQ